MVEHLGDIEKVAGSSPVPPTRFCAKCGIQIPHGRLEAVPNTIHCVKCVGDPAPPDANLICAKSSESARNGFAKNS